jgi:hypothetical protein
MPHQAIIARSKFLETMVCHSASIEGDFRKYVKQFGATLDLPGFERLYWARVNGSKAVVPKSVDDAFAHPETGGEPTLLRKSARGLTP